MTDIVYGDICWYALAAAILGRDPETRKALTPDKAMHVMGIKMNHATKPLERRTPAKGGRPAGTKLPPKNKKISQEVINEVIRLRNQGLYYYEIAAKLGISKTKACEIVQWAERTGQAI